MALSQDRGTASQAEDQGYGIVCDMRGNVIEDAIVINANQEHGIVSTRSGSNKQLPDLPIGTRLRVLPNHACATGAQFSEYHVVRGNDFDRVEVWSRVRGW